MGFWDGTAARVPDMRITAGCPVHLHPHHLRNLDEAHPSPDSTPRPRAARVRRTGGRSGTPVIALHGVTDSWRSFEPVLPCLPSELRVIALTQRGHGASDKPAGGYRTADFAADVAAIA